MRRAIVVLAVLAGTAAIAPLARAQEELTAVVANPIATPEAVLASDGRVHVAYELQLVNRSAAKITVRRIQTLAGGKVVASLSGRKLASLMLPYGDPKPGNVLKAGQAAFVLMDAAFRRRAPRHITHRLRISEEPRSPANATVYLAAPTRVVTRPAVVIAPPLRGPGWLVANGCCSDFTAHRGAVLPVNGALHVAERFAIDFVQIDAMGHLFEGPPGVLSGYPYFGDEVYSVAAGKVVGVLDGLPETPLTGFPPNITAAKAGGNHVVVDIGHNRYAFYAHLQPGSIKVKVGQRVRAGTVLGMLGNSGNSDGPHLHFHIMNGPGPLSSNSVPYRFRKFSLAGTLTNLAPVEGGAMAKVDPKPRGPRTRELPLNLEIVNFE